LSVLLSGEGPQNAPTINGERDLGEGAVGEFHRVALAAGFRDNGPPGERRYHPGYHGEADLVGLSGSVAGTEWNSSLSKGSAEQRRRDHPQPPTGASRPASILV
jgi:hypothetical protein